MTSVMTSRRQGQTQKPNVPKERPGPGRRIRAWAGLTKHTTCDRARIHAARVLAVGGNSGRSLCRQGPLQLIDGAAAHSTLITVQQQYSQSGLRRLPLNEAGQQNKSVGFDLFSSMMQRRCCHRNCLQGKGGSIKVFHAQT